MRDDPAALRAEIARLGAVADKWIAQASALHSETAELRRALAVILSKVEAKPRILAQGGTVYVPLTPAEIKTIRSIVESSK